MTTPDTAGPEPELDEHGRPEPPGLATELDTLLGFLNFQRETLAWRLGGLDADQLGRTLVPSAITLGGMVSHLAFVEDWWFSTVASDVTEPPEPWASIDWDADPDRDWHRAVDQTPEQLLDLWRASIARSDAVTARLIAEDPDALATGHRLHDSRVSLRWILSHMIEEYARHNGHADLVRESIDGQVGE